MALPASEDTGLLIAASVASDGYFTSTPGLLYRKWSGQATSQAAHTDPEERARRMRLVSDRAEALALLGWTSQRHRGSDTQAGSDQWNAPDVDCAKERIPLSARQLHEWFDAATILDDADLRVPALRSHGVAKSDHP